MKLVIAKDWLTDIVDVLDIEYNKTESKKYYCKEIANNFRSCRKGELALCASNSTSLSLDVAAAILYQSIESHTEGKHLIVLPEDHKIDLGMRLLAMKSNASLCNCKSGDIDEEMWPSLIDAIAYFNNKPIFSVYYKDIQPNELYSTINKAANNYSIDKIVFIGYCDLKHIPDKIKEIYKLLNNTKIKDNKKVQLIITGLHNEIEDYYSIDFKNGAIWPDYLVKLIENEKGNVFYAAE